MKPFPWRGEFERPKNIDDSAADVVAKIDSRIQKLIANSSPGGEFLTNASKMAEGIIMDAKNYGIDLKEKFGRTPEEIRALGRRAVMRR